MEQLGELMSRWDKFEQMMESHQKMIQEQVNLSFLSMYPFNFIRSLCSFIIHSLTSLGQCDEVQFRISCQCFQTGIRQVFCTLASVKTQGYYYLLYIYSIVNILLYTYRMKTY